ncbi:MAG: SLBB domain-containing protein [Chloroflexi bacterium]|nr:SLBB domain-containing protein [Chloroflexota bacterium]
MKLPEFRELQRKARADWEALQKPEKPVIIVGMGGCGIAKGAKKVLAAVEAELRRLGVQATVRKTGCIGIDSEEPLVDIIRPGRPRVSYRRVSPEMVPELLRSCLVRGDHRPDLAMATIADEAFDGIPSWRDLDFFRNQQRIVLRNAGHTDPDSIEDYIARGGYQALAKALTEMAPEDVIEEMKKSGLRGRGGAGFPCGIKWESARTDRQNPKYMICNAHEGEPNVFKDRRILEADPHAVIEGLIIAGYAIGTRFGYIYVGAEFPLAVERTLRAIKEARKFGFLGERILGSKFSYDISPKLGGGAYVCGESSALMFSIEGKRGMPRTKPPRSVEFGLWGKPTSLNNVETLSNVAQIIVNGGDWYAGIGTEGSKGTKVFSLSGMIKRPGLIEVPMGTTLRELVYGAGGGILNDREFKAVQTGGPSGGCLPSQHLDLPVDFESLDSVGGNMGSGGFVVFDETICMVDVSRYFMKFNRDHSCGKCTPCRLGTKASLEILERIASGNGREGDVELLEHTGRQIIDLSLCGLGQTAPLPVLSAIQYFRDEFDTHINEKRCPAGVCEIATEAESSLVRQG